MAVIQVTCPEHEPIEGKDDDGETMLVCTCGFSCATSPSKEDFRRLMRHLLEEGGTERFLAFDIIQSLYGRAIRVL